jgi:hypothetical protein
LLTQFNRRTGPQTQGNKTLPHALLTQFNRRTCPQTQGNKMASTMIELSEQRMW